MTLDLPASAYSSTCQRWTGRRQSWRPVGEPFHPGRYEVRPIADDTTARNFVIANHYSGSYVSALHRFGLYHAARLVGVAVYSSPTSNAVLTCVLPDLRPHVESVELGRFVLEDAVPGNGESWFLARCHEQLQAAGVAGVVSFADPIPRQLPTGEQVAPGHVGTIYQASNAVYTGRGCPRTLWVLPDATIMNGKALQKIRDQDQGHGYAERLLQRWGASPMLPGEDPKLWLRKAKADAGVRTFRHPGNHRYVFRLGRHARRHVRVALPAQTYPKHADTRVLIAAPDTGLVAALEELMTL